MTKMAERPRLFADWRDFGREYIIVVLGVLTALLAQSAVEEFSWRQKVSAAISDMDQEVSTGNGPQAYARLSIYQCAADRLQRLRALAEGGDRKEVIQAIAAIQLPLRNYNSSARDAANSADITAHMPADRKYDYRILYALTPELDAIHRKELEDLAVLRSLPASGGPLDLSEKRLVLGAAENLALDNDRVKRASVFTLRRMREIGIRLDKDQLRRNFADLPAYRNCLNREIGPMLKFQPMNAGGR
ncbi:MAG: hypothetical protein V4513_11125 [Pseudomonadota bacterium]